MDDKLYPHQIVGAKWLADVVGPKPCGQRGLSRAALFDEQGLGKTITAIEAANICRRDASEVRLQPWRVLIICPLVVTWNWKREWEKWCDGRGYSDSIEVITRLDQELMSSRGVTIMSHRALIDERIFDQIVDRKWDLVILDEAHMFRSRQAQRTKAFYGDVRDPEADSVIKHAERVWLLTGTPMPNDVRDLWSMCRGMWPHRILTKRLSRSTDQPMSFGAFEERYCVTQRTRWGKRAVANKNPEELRERLKGVTLRRRKRDHLALPPMRYESIALRPEQLSRELVEAELSAHARVSLSNADNPERAFSALGQDLQMSTWRRLVGLAKVEPVAELLKMELANSDESIVVFAHHTQVINALQIHMHEAGIDCVRITGDTTATERHVAVDRFQYEKNTQVALCNIVAGGTGVTLTRSTEVLFAELSWVPGENAQAAERIYRIGQTRPCRARFVSLAGTIDEAIVEVLRRKVRMISEVIR